MADLQQNIPLRAFHVMRTYGNHGGEKQLAQMFAQPSDVQEHFVFLYHDKACEKLLSHAAKLRFHRLWLFSLRPRYRAKSELLILLLLLPWLQIRLFFLLLCHRPQACVVHGFQAALVAWPSAMLLGKKTGFAYFHRITKSATGRHPLFKLIYKPYRKLIGVSLAVTSSLHGLADESRLATIENGVDTVRFLPALPEAKRHLAPVIIAVGRLLPHKGQRIIMDAFLQCSEEFPTLELWIVGDGQDRSILEQAIAEYRVGGRIQLLGRREDIAELLAKATIFCHASNWEGMSNSVLEAMAAGLPSIVADAPGVTECHENGITGFVVERNSGAFADKIAMLLRAPQLRKCMGLKALQRIEMYYSIRANREKFLTLYKELGDNACVE